MRKLLGFVLLAELFGLSIWFAIDLWIAIASPLMAEGERATGLGIAFTLIVGCGLTALVFYSSREPIRRKARPIKA